LQQDLQALIEWVPNALTTKRPLLLTPSKDKPVLISALEAKRNTLMTLDTGDFGIFLGTEVWGAGRLTLGFSCSHRFWVKWRHRVWLHPFDSKSGKESGGLLNRRKICAA
jgi:hypothetical protein